jgi:hypothetical protein
MKKKNYVLIKSFVAAILLTDCGGANVSEISNSKSKIVIIQHNPPLTFKIESIRKGEDHDARFGDNSETKIIFQINGIAIDSDIEIGIGEAFNIKDSVNGIDAIANVSGEISEKYYTAGFENDTSVYVLKRKIENGEDKIVWKKIYGKYASSEWSLINCIGDC